MAKFDSTIETAVPVTAIPAQGAGNARMIRIGLSVLIVILVIVFGIWYWTPPDLHGVMLQSPHQASDFTLDTSNGTQANLIDFRGKYVLLYFGYTFCPDVCPVTLNELAQMANELGERRMRDVQVIFVTVDPERDTQARLATYLDYFDPSFLGMTGPLTDVQNVASQFGIYFQRQSEDKPSYLVDHTNAVTVVDPQGYVRMVFPGDVDGADMAADLTYLMRR